VILRFLTLTRKHSLLALAWLAILLSSHASAAVHHVPGAGPPDVGAVTIAPSMPRGDSLDDVLDQNGIVPGSQKARVLAEWVDMIVHDPTIGARIPGGMHALFQVFVDERKREAMMSSGLARLTPNERLDYLKLFTRLLDELVPVNCFELVDMHAVMNRITFSQMSDEDAALYLRLLYRVLVSSVSDITVRLPTQAEYDSAIEGLSRAIVMELDADPASMDRYQQYVVHPSAATPADVCWTTRVTLHAIARMSETERDFVLLPAISGSAMEPFEGTSEDKPAQAPLPLREQSTGKAIH